MTDIQKPARFENADQRKSRAERKQDKAFKFTMNGGGANRVRAQTVKDSPKRNKDSPKRYKDSPKRGKIPKFNKGMNQEFVPI